MIWFLGFKGKLNFVLLLRCYFVVPAFLDIPRHNMTSPAGMGIAPHGNTAEPGQRADGATTATRA